MGLIYNLQKESDLDIVDWSELDDYIEFENLLDNIANYSKDTPALVAEFLYKDGAILQSTAYGYDVIDNKAYVYKISDVCEMFNEMEYETNQIEWYFETYLESENIGDFWRACNFETWLLFKKTDIINLDCLKKIGFVDLSLLRECDEVEWLKSKIAEKDEIIDRLVKNSSYQIQTDHASTAYIAELEKQSTDDKRLGERTENSYLTTIGLLLDLLKTPKGFDRGNKPNKPLFDSNAQIIQAITDFGIHGQGKSTLENRFGKANTALDQAKKK